MTEILYRGDREWKVEVHGSTVTTTYGKIGGKLTSSSYDAVPKNVGKANATTAEVQAHLEADALRVKKMKEGYSATKGEVTPFRPMLAKDGGKHLGIDASDIIWMQPKLDGVRAFDTALDNVSRNGRRFGSNVVFLSEGSIAYLEDDEYDIIFDGEWYKHGMPFEEISSLVKQERFEELEYHIFDCYLPKKPDMSFSARLAIIESLEFDGEHIKVVPTVALEELEREHLSDTVDWLVREVQAAGYEGIMLRTNTAYEPNKRSKGLWKVKQFDDEEMIIEKVYRTPKGQTMMVVLDPVLGDMTQVQVNGTQKFVDQVWEDKDKLPGKEATVRYQGRTEMRSMRFPKIVGVRDYE